MSFVKFVEDQDRDSRQLRVINHLPQQEAFGHEANFRFRAGHVLEANLVTDFTTELHPEFFRHASGEQASGQSPGLKDHDLPLLQEAVLEQHLRHLCGFARAGRCGQNQSPVLFQTGNDVLFDVVNRQSFSHARADGSGAAKAKAKINSTPRGTAEDLASRAQSSPRVSTGCRSRRHVTEESPGYTTVGGGRTRRFPLTLGERPGVVKENVAHPPVHE